MSEGDLKDIIHSFNIELVLDSFHLLSGGLSHTNYKVLFKNQTEPLVVRMTEKVENLQMEHHLHRLILEMTNSPIPTFHHITEWKNHSVGILEWKKGVFLKDRMFLGDNEENFNLGFSAGSHLAHFRKVTFERPGFLNEQLKVKEAYQLTPDSFIGFVGYFTEGKSGKWLNSGLAEKLIAFASKHAPLFSEDDSGPALVHGDYNGLNILVGQKEVNAILDWEFALSGSIYIDIGNMLRYDTIPHYHDFEKGFVEGIQQSGVSLSEKWRELAKLADLISLLSMLDNDMGGEMRVKDINNLISRTIFG